MISGEDRTGQGAGWGEPTEQEKADEELAWAEVLEEQGAENLSRLRRGLFIFLHNTFFSRPILSVRVWLFAENNHGRH